MAINSVSDQTPAILCVDFGGTRSKACVFAGNITSLSDLRGVPIYNTPTQLYLRQHETIGEIFQRRHANPLLSPLHNSPYTKIAVGVKGTVLTNGSFEGDPRYNVSKDLAAMLQAQVIEDYSLHNDAVAWAVGALEYQALKSQRVNFPALAITLGTGIGAAYCENPTKIFSVNISCILRECPFPLLQEMSTDQPMKPIWSPHKTLGKAYFDWVFKGQPFKDDQMDTHLEEYNRRFRTFIEELAPFVNKKIGILQSLIVGGGNSRFIDDAEFTAFSPQNIYLLTPKRLEAEKTPPDIISLLGAKLALERHLQPCSFPPDQELLLEKARLREISGEKLH